MQRKRYTPGRTGSAARTAVVLTLGLGLGIGLTACSAGTPAEDVAVDAKAGPAAPVAPPGRYRTLFEPCGAVPQATLKDLLPGAAALADPERDKAYRGVAAVTYDTDRRVGCTWKADTPDISHRLVLDIERVVSYDTAVSDDDRAQEVYVRKQLAAGIPLAPTAPPTTTPPTSPGTGTPRPVPPPRAGPRRARRAPRPASPGGRHVLRGRSTLLGSPRHGSARLRSDPRRPHLHRSRAPCPRRPRGHRVPRRRPEHGRRERPAACDQRGVPHIQRHRDRLLPGADDRLRRGPRQRGAAGKGPESGPAARRAPGGVAVGVRSARGRTPRNVSAYPWPHAVAVPVAAGAPAGPYDERLKEPCSEQPRDSPAYSPAPPSR